MASNQSSVARVTFHLPIEITTEILSRLPVESLLRFKSVCKTWYDLIKTPHFISQHLQNQSTLNFTSLLVASKNPRTELYQMSLLSHNGLNNSPIMNHHLPFSIVGTCNGLVCIAFSPYVRPLILCNPSTRQFQEIPNPKWLDEIYYDPDKKKKKKINYERNKRVSYGFGFHPSANDYKLIRIVQDFSSFNEPSIQADLYVMSTNAWTKIDANKLSVFFGEKNELGKYGTMVRNLGRSASAVFNGVFYWWAFVIHKVIIISFDMGHEVFRRIRKPVPLDCFDEHHQKSTVGIFWQLTELKGKLALVDHSNGRNLKVWVLNADQNSWTNQFKVRSFPGISHNGRFDDIGEIRVVGCAKNGELVVIDRHGSGDFKLFLYDIQTLKRTDLYFGWFLHRSDCYLYTETLLPVMQTNEALNFG